MLLKHAKIQNNLFRQLNKHPKLCCGLRKQQGIVIVFALFFVALVAALSYYMVARLDRDLERVNLILNHVQAKFYARGSIAWAKMQLKENWEKQQSDKPIDTMPLKSTVNVVDGYKIQSTIYDLQARYNINNVQQFQNPNQGNLKNFLRALNKDLSDDQALSIVAAIMDWVSPEHSSKEFNEYYQNASPPYTSPHKPMVSISELQLVKGVTPAIYQTLRPFLVALPKPTPINIQTAPPPVLMLMSPNMTLDQAVEIARIREQTPFKNPQAIQNLDIMKNNSVSPDNVTTTSQFFLVETTVSKDDLTLIVYSLMDRTIQEGKAKVTVLWESEGIW